MRLHELTPPRGARHAAKRKGRGPASGLGKTAGRGQKGQMARSGARVRRAFEGGQMPLFQRLPKRGFTNTFKQKWSVINVEALNRFDDGTTVTPQLLKEAGLLKSLRDPLKVLGDGELKRKLVVQAHRFSSQAQAKIEAAGGKAEVI
ncbi:MAG: 50S ribosomal protein L15 [Firmicutes bacterium]|jgi:large subunit ribosomal protein L15|nr:50S ribosomal protein L15 [Bacillota bacterium]HPU01497.1 50S ribosomal protein L15 [Bacillota bacterium]